VEEALGCCEGAQASLGQLLLIAIDKDNPVREVKKSEVKTERRDSVSVVLPYPLQRRQISTEAR
jgi:hypothetical protein